MAYFSLHAYDADVWIPEFKGLNQADIELNPDIRFASEAENVETPNGVLQPQAAFTELSGEFEDRVETLAYFYRRWYEGSGSKTWYVSCSGGKLYYKQAEAPAEWMEIELPTGIDSFENSNWSWVTYEINPENTDYTVDVLLISNANDGMYMIVPPDKPTTHDDLSEFTHEALSAKTHDEMSSAAWVVRTVDTQNYKFGVIERYAERIWGGAIAGNPDMLMYSAPYDPTDWEQNEDIPEDGAGEIRQPSWDGDEFYALKRFGDQLLAFKRNRIWRVLNTSPGEYVFQEQYGGGTPFFNTIAVDKERVYMESMDGLTMYDGMSASAYLRPQVEQLWRTVNRNAMDQMCAVLYQGRYYVAFPEGDSLLNNAMMVYNMVDGTILLYRGIDIESFLPTDDNLFITSSSLPGKILKLNYDSWVTGKTTGEATKWVSPWMDFGYKRIQKGGFDMYFIPEVQNEAVTLKFSIQTEKKLKIKEYTVQPLTEEQKAKPREHRGKRLHFGGMGRKFRVIIETEAGNTAPWRLIGGIQMVVETDPD